MHWYTWVFSGVGVLALSGAGKLVWDILKPSVPNPKASVVTGLQAQSVTQSPIATGDNVIQNIHYGNAQRVTPDFSDYKKSPSPAEIREHLDSLPPFQKEVVKDSFVGLKVCWRASFLSVSKSYGSTEHRLSLYYGNNPRDIVACAICVDDYPRLKVALRDERIEIAGTIKSAEFGIELTDVSLFFPSELDGSS